MPRIRTVKPEFWQHEDLSELPPEVHMLAAALLNYADDEGYFNANPKLVKAACCPLRDDSTSIRRSLDLLSSVGYLRLGQGEDGKQYGHIVKFCEHQRVDRKKASKIKSLDIDWDDSKNNRRVIDDESTQEGKGREGKGTTTAADAANEYSIEFERAWRKYPKREGGNPKKRALKAWRARIREGVTNADLEAGVERYAAHVRTKGKERTEFVMQAATFFGPDEHWREYGSQDAPPRRTRPLAEAMGEQ